MGVHTFCLQFQGLYGPPEAYGHPGNELGHSEEPLCFPILSLGIRGPEPRGLPWATQGAGSGTTAKHLLSGVPQ